MVSKENSEDIMFSVEITTYNQKEYIAQSLQSILDQEHNYKYEILVSDDCSTDGTQDIIREFEKKYPDIVKPVYNEKNLGAMSNYYATVARAKGKYLMGCGGDDYWLPGKVEKQISFMERNLDFDVCYSLARILDVSNINCSDFIGGHYADYKDLFYKGNNIPALTICTRRDFFSKYMIDVNPIHQNWIMEDLPFLLYTVFEAKNIFFMNQSLAVYRLLKESLSHSDSLRKNILFSIGSSEIRKYFSKKYSIDYEVPDLRQTIFKLFCSKKKSVNNKHSLTIEYKNLLKEYKIKNIFFIKLKYFFKSICHFFVPAGILMGTKSIVRRTKCEN